MKVTVYTKHDRKMGHPPTVFAASYASYAAEGRMLEITDVSDGSVHGIPVNQILWVRKDKE